MLLATDWPKILFLAGILYGWQIPAESQTVRFYNSFDSLQSGNSYHLIGQVGQQNLVLYTTSLLETGLLICDSNGNAVDRKILPLPTPILSRHVTALGNHFDIVFQKRVDNMNYVQIARFDQHGNMEQSPRVIDSSRYDLLGRAAYYEIGGPVNNHFKLLYRLLHGLQKDKLLVNYLLLDSTASICDSRNFYIPFDSELDTASIPYVDPSGTVVMAIHDKAANYRLGSTIRVYHTAPGKEMKTGKIYLKENKPVILSFASSASNGKLYLGALSQNFYRKEIDGVVAVRYDLATAQADTSFYYKLDDDFNKELLKEISGINAKNLKKRLALTYFDINTDGDLSFALSLVSMKKVRNNWDNAHVSSSRSNVSLNSSTPSQSLDAIRDFARATALPANTRAGSPQMDQYMQRQLALQSQGITSPQAAPSVAPAVAGQTRHVGAPDEMLWTLMADPNMMHKTYYFKIDSQYRPSSKSWEQHLYFPRAPLLTAAVLKVNNEVSMIHYAVKKNGNTLTYKPLQRHGEIAAQPIGKPGDPQLFFGRRYTMISHSKLLTLYLDQHLRIGLASMNMEH